jgi:hypothetical protein
VDDVSATGQWDARRSGSERRWKDKVVEAVAAYIAGRHLLTEVVRRRPAVNCNHLLT